VDEDQGGTKDHNICFFRCWLCLRALTAPAGSGQAAALGVPPGAFARLPDSAGRFIDQAAMASMTVGAAFASATEGRGSLALFGGQHQ